MDQSAGWRDCWGMTNILRVGAGVLLALTACDSPGEAKPATKAAPAKAGKAAEKTDAAPAKAAAKPVAEEAKAAPEPGERADAAKPGAEAAANPDAPDAAAALPDLPENRIEYDLPIIGDKKGGFDVSFAIVKRGRPQTGQGSLTVFGPEVKPGDKGSAKDWQDICDTRLNAFGRTTHGLFLDLNKIDPLPGPDPTAKIKSGATFRLQGGGWSLPYGDFKSHGAHDIDVRFVGGDDKELEIAVNVTEPGQQGALRGRFKARVCPPS